MAKPDGMTESLVYTGGMLERREALIVEKDRVAVAAFGCDAVKFKILNIDVEQQRGFVAKVPHLDFLADERLAGPDLKVVDDLDLCGLVFGPEHAPHPVSVAARGPVTERIVAGLSLGGGICRRQAVYCRPILLESEIAKLFRRNAHGNKLIDQAASEEIANRLSRVHFWCELVHASGLDGQDILTAELQGLVAGVIRIKDKWGWLTPASTQLSSADFFAVDEHAVILPVLVVVAADRNTDRLSLRIAGKLERGAKPSIAGLDGIALFADGSETLYRLPVGIDEVRPVEALLEAGVLVRVYCVGRSGGVAPEGDLYPGRRSGERRARLCIGVQGPRMAGDLVRDGDGSKPAPFLRQGPLDQRVADAEDVAFLRYVAFF